MLHLSHLCVLCKKCDEKIRIPNNRIADYMEFVKSNGWLLSAESIGEAYCPDCTRSLAISYIMDKNSHCFEENHGF